MVIITKCPKDLKPMEYRVLTRAMELYPYQDLFFTTLVYKDLQAVFGDKKLKLTQLEKETNILLLTGIASPRQMVLDLQPYGAHIVPLTFADHHNFKKCDIESINEVFDAMPSPKIIITTEKDKARLTDVEGLNEEVRNALYALPIEVQFMLNGKETFNKKILSYVRKNSRNSILAKNKDDNKA